MTRSAWLRRVPGLVALALGGWIGWYAGTFPELEGGHPGPALFPRLVAAGLVLCGLLLLWKPGPAEGPDVEPAGWAGRGRFVAGLLLVVAFPWLQGLLGFVPVAALLALAIGLMLGARWLPLVVSSAVAAGVVYLLFTRLLGVPL
ncbi:MAG: tripartite tricarboxylate transporter TctB family protein [Rhodothermales bacterium]